MILIHQRHRQTDRQTDNMQSQYRASRGKNRYTLLRLNSLRSFHWHTTGQYQRRDTSHFWLGSIFFLTYFHQPLMVLLSQLIQRKEKCTIVPPNQAWHIDYRIIIFLWDINIDKNDYSSVVCWKYWLNAAMTIITAVTRVELVRTCKHEHNGDF